VEDCPCECCVLTGRGLCVGVITSPEESYRVWCVWVWSCNLSSEWTWPWPWPTRGCYDKGGGGVQGNEN